MARKQIIEQIRAALSAARPGQDRTTILGKVIKLTPCAR